MCAEQAAAAARHAGVGAESGRASSSGAIGMMPAVGGCDTKRVGMRASASVLAADPLMLVPEGAALMGSLWGIIWRSQRWHESAVNVCCCGGGGHDCWANLEMTNGWFVCDFTVP